MNLYAKSLALYRPNTSRKYRTMKTILGSIHFRYWKPANCCICSITDIWQHRLFCNVKMLHFQALHDCINECRSVANVRFAGFSTDGKQIPSVQMNERDRIMCETPGRMCSIPKPMWDRIEDIKAMLHEEVRGNEFCPCQLGLKYKKCCGKEE